MEAVLVSLATGRDAGKGSGSIGAPRQDDYGAARSRRDETLQRFSPDGHSHDWNKKTARPRCPPRPAVSMIDLSTRPVFAYKHGLSLHHGGRVEAASGVARTEPFCRAQQVVTVRRLLGGSLLGTLVSVTDPVSGLSPCGPRRARCTCAPPFIFCLGAPRTLCGTAGWLVAAKLLRNIDVATKCRGQPPFTERMQQRGW